MVSVEIAAHSMPISLPIEIALDLIASHLNRAIGPASLVANDLAHESAGRLRLPGIIGQAPTVQFMRILHLFPTAEQALDPALFDQLSNGGRIGFLMPGLLAPIVARLRQQPSEAPTPFLNQAASKHGLRVIEKIGIGGPRSFFWAAMVGAGKLAARPDLQDRFEFRYRRTLAPSSRHRASLLTALVLERP